MKLVAFIILFGLLFLFYGCTQAEYEKTTIQTSSQSQENSTQVLNQPSSQSSSSIKEFKITAKKWSFTPSTITVNKGDKVRIILTSEDVAHGISIKEFDFDLTVDAKETKTGEFLATKSGTFKFFCNTYCGDGHSSMEGLLIVK